MNVTFKDNFGMAFQRLFVITHSVTIAGTAFFLLYLARSLLCSGVASGGDRPGGT